MLYNACTGTNKEDRDSCKTWIAGFMAGAVYSQSLLSYTNREPIICFPEPGIVPAQAELIIEKYMRDHPEQMHLDAPALAINALWKAFPCSPGQNSK